MQSSQSVLLAALLLAAHSSTSAFFIVTGAGNGKHASAHRRSTVPAAAAEDTASSGNDAIEESWTENLSASQKKSWAFLKKKGIVGYGQKASGFQTTGRADARPQATEEENYKFAEMQGQGIKEVIQEALEAYGEDEKTEKRVLKQRVLAGETLAEAERARLEELKSRNRAFKAAERKMAGPVLKKTALAFVPCNVSGVIDDMNEAYPVAACGTEWTKSTDAVMGGVSRADVSATSLAGSDGVERKCILLKGRVSTAYNGGFIQMALDLSNAIPPGTPVDASAFSGIELDVFCPRGESYNVHLRTPDCLAFPSSYRASFETKPRDFTTVRLPWSAFEGSGPGAEDRPLDTGNLRRLGVLGFGRNFVAELAVAGVRLYSED